MEGMDAGESTGEVKGGAESVFMGGMTYSERSFQDLGDGSFLGAAGQAQEDILSKTIKPALTDNISTSGITDQCSEASCPPF